MKLTKNQKKLAESFEGKDPFGAAHKIIGKQDEKIEQAIDILMHGGDRGYPALVDDVIDDAIRKLKEDVVV